jgi:hypothetical protein
MTMTDTRTTARRAPEPIEQVRPARYIPVAARRAVVTEYRRFRANHAPRQAMLHIHTHYSLDVADRLASAGEVYGATLDRYRAASVYLQRIDRQQLERARRRQAGEIARRQAAAQAALRCATGDPA